MGGEGWEAMRWARCAADSSVPAGRWRGGRRDKTVGWRGWVWVPRAYLGQRLPLVVGLQRGPRGGVGGGGHPPWGLADVGAGAEEVVVDAYAVRWCSGVNEVRGGRQVRVFVGRYKLSQEACTEGRSKIRRTGGACGRDGSGQRGLGAHVDHSAGAVVWRPRRRQGDRPAQMLAACPQCTPHKDASTYVVRLVRMQRSSKRQGGMVLCTVRGGHGHGQVRRFRHDALPPQAVEVQAHVRDAVVAHLLVAHAGMGKGGGGGTRVLTHDGGWEGGGRRRRGEVYQQVGPIRRRLQKGKTNTRTLREKRTRAFYKG